MNVNMSSILDRPFDEVKFPKLPVGSYVGVVLGLPRFDESAKKRTKFAEFQIKLFEAMDDVDPDELEAFGSIVDKQLPITFYYETEGGHNRLRKFCENCGLDLSKYRSAQQAMQDCAGKTIIVEIKHTPSQDGQSVYAQIDGTAKAD